MILNRLTLCNFRQYINKNTIKFSGPLETPSHNVTVIFGENGRGKTGLYRAVVFALFGEARLPQDEDVLPEDLRLVNASAIQEAAEREVVKAEVELEFEHRGSKYTLQRFREAIRHGSNVIEEPGSAVLTILQEDGNTSVVEDAVLIKQHVEAILDPRVKDYYLFDGERMDRLTRAGASQRREVAKGIRSLLNIDALENARAAMTRVTERFTSDLAKASSVEYAKVLREMETCEADISRIKSRLERIEDELARAEDEIQKTERELEAFREIKEHVMRRQDLNKRLDQRERERQAIGLTLSNLVSRCGVLLISQAISNTYENIEARRRKGELPAEIRRDLIERVIRDDQCICGRPVNCDPHALHCIESWRERTAEEAIEDAALRLWQHLGGIVSHIDDYEHEITGQLQLYGSASNDITEFSRQLEIIKEAIGNSERDDALQLEEHRAMIEDKRVDLRAEQKNLGIELSTKKLTLDQLNAKREEEAAKEARKDEITSRVELSRKVTNALGVVHGQFTSEIRARLAALATSALGQLLDRAGQASICGVSVNEDYSLEVTNRFNEPWLAEISAGQRQILSIAFIAALAESASNGRLLEMPLFMDTPFGRLGSEHRENLMRLVPTKAAQWVLLATDTEFRIEEAQMLHSTGKWGKLYFLRADESGNTIIEERHADIRSFEGYVRMRKSQ